MIPLVEKFFGKITNNASDVSEKPPHDIRIATCALLLEMSQIDGEFSESERKSILSIITKDYHLDNKYATAILEAAHEELKKNLKPWQAGWKKFLMCCLPFLYLFSEQGRRSVRSAWLFVDQ